MNFHQKSCFSTNKKNNTLSICKHVFKLLASFMFDFVLRFVTFYANLEVIDFTLINFANILTKNQML